MNEKWEVEFKPTAFKELKKLDRKTQTQVLNFFEKLVESHESPRLWCTNIKMDFREGMKLVEFTF